MGVCASGEKLTPAEVEARRKKKGKTKPKKQRKGKEQRRTKGKEKQNSLLTKVFRFPFCVSEKTRERTETEIRWVYVQVVRN